MSEGQGAGEAAEKARQYGGVDVGGIGGVAQDRGYHTEAAGTYEASSDSGRGGPQMAHGRAASAPRQKRR